jgi:hypothetical protein
MGWHFRQTVVPANATDLLLESVERLQCEEERLPRLGSLNDPSGRTAVIHDGPSDRQLQLTVYCHLKYCCIVCP